MAVVDQSPLSETRRRTLEAVCDTIVPAVESASSDPLEREFMGRAASEMGVAGHIEAMLAQAMLPEEIEALGGLLDALEAEGFSDAPVEARTAIIHAFREADPDAKLGLHQLKALTILLFYALPDELGSNPNWDHIGYPGAPAAPPSPDQAPKTLTTVEVSGESATLTADVCVIGSGAGGGVIAAECAKAGKEVLVLEMGGYRSESDFSNLELLGYQELYYGAGLAASESGSIAILAGQTLGGGTVVNYMNCVRTPEKILAEWAEHGLEGVDDPGFIADHQEVVLDRLGANTEATFQNAIHRKLMTATSTARSSATPSSTTTPNSALTAPSAASAAANAR